MDRKQFWTIVDLAHAESRGDMDKKCRALEQHLLPLSVNDIGDFVNHFDALMESAYTWELWGAAYLIGGGCSDDAFMDFRSTLISFGQSTFEAALANPETLGSLKLNEDSAFYEGYGYMGREIYEKRAGKPHARVALHPKDPKGREWNESDLPKLFPTLWKQYE